MKVLFVAVFDERSTNNSQARGFERAGCEVLEYNYRKRAEVIGNHKRDDELIFICKREKPDIVLFSKCNEIHHRVVTECNKISKTILWFMDPKNGGYNASLINKIKLCDFTFCSLTEPYLESTKYSKNVYFLQEGFDSDVNIYLNIPYKHDVSFIGSLRGERGKYQKKYGFYNFTNAYAKEHSVAVCETKINLNFTEGGTSDRTYKLLASKGFVLTQPWPRMEEDWEIGGDLDIFRNEAEFEEKVKYYLENENDRLKIAENGYNKVQKFSRNNWAKRILEIIS